MRRRDRQRLAYAQLEKLIGDGNALHALGLVDNQQHRTPGLAQLFGDDFVLRRAALATIHQKQHDIGFVHRLPRLFGHFEHDAFFGHRLQTAGINYQEWPFAYSSAPVVTVARQPRLVRHQCIAAARESVEQRGFADVGSTNQN